ncbi:Short-chain dehydrogenase/reductase SDR [Rhodopirellula islandica]|uniref:Short-chain dehydrogenase/reductase SDR n=1 Tax=Rhodopirellula islandica TaxID=595434 RepID=A0A0J1B7E8_RHOIS|nr:SDR family oxidoreductase [Rhodopirellula islandica]KLU02755.1 Short-chain dehydrogenase/reductase SDR [Rhodopirellula islandica]
MSTNIEGKVVVITGASSGLGEDAARHLASQGAAVVLGARRIERLDAIVSEIRQNGGKAEALATDVTDVEQVQALVNKAVDAFGRVDVVINNAGLMSIAPLSELKVDEWERMIDINIKGVLYGIAAGLPIFQSQGTGHFINISSVAGLKVVGGGAVYSGTKFAVRAISEGLRTEVGGAIRTTTILPGLIDTELKQGTSHGASSQTVDEMYKMAISPTAITDAIAYAISQPADVDVNEIVVRPTVQEF